jgi:transcriptional regulator with XRE-family HTH domain
MNEVYEKFGKLLRLERQRQGLSLDDLSDKLKISVPNLECIEAGRLNALPSQLYYNLFAKSYAEALGIDHSATIEAIKEDIGQPLEPQAKASKERHTERKEHEAGVAQEARTADDESKAGGNLLKKFVYLLAGLVVVFVIFMVVSMILSGSEPTEQADKPGARPQATSETEPLPPEQATFAGFDWDVPAYQKSSDLELVLAPKRESWATVLADGDTVVFRTLVPGRTWWVTARYRLRVSIGVPSAVDVTLSGKPVDLRDPLNGRVSKVEINQVNLESFLNRAPQERDAEGNQEPGPTRRTVSENTTGDTVLTGERSDDEP